MQPVTLRYDDPKNDRPPGGPARPEQAEVFLVHKWSQQLGNGCEKRSPMAAQEERANLPGGQSALCFFQAPDPEWAQPK